MKNFNQWLEQIDSDRCEDCGAAIEPGSIFCPKCKEKRCPDCGEEKDPEEENCPRCKDKHAPQRLSDFV